MFIFKILSFFRKKKQLFRLTTSLENNDTVIIPSNSFFNANGLKSIQKKTFVFTRLTKDRYDLIIRHKSHALHQNRKLAWATFEISGAAKSKYISQRLGLAFGKTGMLSYIGGGRAIKGIYQSGTSVNIYKKTDFVIIQLITSSKDDFDIQEIGLIGKTTFNKVLLPSSQDASQQNIIHLDRLREKLIPILDQDTYVIYANISPNVADGSSIWLSSVTDIVAHNSKVILLLKEDLRSNIIVSNITQNKNVILLQPSDYSTLALLDEKNALDITKLIDDIHPQLRAVFVRGINAANALISDRRFKYRSISYITDFYEVKNGKIEITLEKKQLVKNIALQSYLMLIQTKEMKNKLFSLIGYEHPNYAYLPPSLPDSIFKTSEKKQEKNKNTLEIKIGYAGKIMPNWGVEELLSWAYEFNQNSRNIKIRLFIAANKISAPGDLRKSFVSKILNLIKQAQAEHYTTFNREQCIDLLKNMDYVWAYRPGYFEDNTLELSTKLLEAIAMQQRVICYPSIIHKNELGSNYPFYVRNQIDFETIIKGNSKQYDLSHIATQLQNKHSISNVANRIKNLSPFKINNSSIEQRVICFASHDFKFIDAYISHLKVSGYRIVRDNWEWGKAIDNEQSKKHYEQSDIIFCEWGLANAVWFSKNNIKDKPIYIRVHAQEIRERAQKFGRQIDFDKITKVIFVSKRVQKEYIRLFNIPEEKTIFIPNFVSDDEFTLSKNQKSDLEKIVLGMVGIVPQLKRFDRAVEVLENLIKKGINAELRIKGHRPENLEFMKVPSRAQEMAYYQEIYNNIQEKGLSDKVIFDGWGNDVALWYKDIDFILSPSDTESFHYALADGVLSGCIPIVWNWEESINIYKGSWIIKSNNEAVQNIEKYISKFDKKLLHENREFIVERYGMKQIIRKLSNTIFQ